MTNINSAFYTYDETVEKSKTSYSGLLGLAINGNRIVNHPTRAGYVYVRLRDNLSEVVQAFNDKVSPVYDFPVLIQRKGNRWYVLGRDDLRYDSWGTSAPYLPRHGDQHSFNRDGGGGGDVTWVYPDQFMPLLVYPSGTYGASNLLVAPYVLQKSDKFIYVGNTGTANIVRYKPTNSSAIMGLVYLDRDTGNPGFLINSGTTFSGAITGTNAVIPYLPYPSSTQEPLYAFRLVSGTTSITWDNLYNVRQFIGGSTSTGTSGGVSDHESLTGLLGGSANNHYHLTPSQVIGLVSGTSTVLHSHSGTYLSSVATDATLTGDGSSASPITVVQSYPIKVNPSVDGNLVSFTGTTGAQVDSGIPVGDVLTGTGWPFNFWRILYTDAVGNVAENDRLIFDPTTDQISLGMNDGSNNANIRIGGNTGNASTPNSTPSLFRGITYGTSSTTTNLFKGVASQGTKAAPTASLADDFFAHFNGTGYTGAGNVESTSSNGGMSVVANENWSATNRGTRLDFFSTPNAATAKVKAFTINADGTVNIASGKTYNINGSPLAAANVGAVPNDGWIATSWASLTRTSNTVFTSTTDLTGTIQKGTKLKLTDTTTKYFVVKSAVYSAGTSTITLMTTTDFSLAGNPSAIYYSNIENPHDWPGKFNFMPTVTSSIGSITAYTVNSCIYIVAGRKIDFFANITITTNGTADGSVLITIPADVFTAAGGAGRENALTGSMLQVQGGTTVNLLTYSNGSPFAGDGANFLLHAVWDW